MTDNVFKLEPVEEAEQSTADKTGFNLLLLGLKALSQRAIVAAATLFTLLSVASAFALWWMILSNPSILQLVGVGMYAAFILAANLIVKGG